jgi:type I restriction enzyme, S subunit
MIRSGLTEIVRRVDRLIALADEVQQRVEEAHRKVQSSSQAVLAKAFRGELIGAASRAV